VRILAQELGVEAREVRRASRDEEARERCFQAEAPVTELNSVQGQSIVEDSASHERGQDSERREGRRIKGERCGLRCGEPEKDQACDEKREPESMPRVESCQSVHALS